MKDLTINQKRGYLISRLRKKTTCKSKIDFCRKYDIPLSTLKYWETNVPDNVSTHGLQKLVDAFNSEGVTCSIESILNLGDEDYYSEFENAEIVNLNQSFFKDSFIKELAYKESLIAAKLIKDSMEPYYSKNDIFLGTLIKDASFDLALGNLCIIRTFKGIVIIKFLGESNINNSFCLYPAKDKSYKTLFLNKDDILSIAIVKMVIFS